MGQIRPVLVTGATGFIGRHITDLLRKGGVNLTLAVRDGAKVRREWADDPGVRIAVVPDLASADVAHLVAGATAVVHAAGIADVGRLDRARLVEIGVTATQRLVEAAAAAGAVQFVFLSSVLALSSNVSAEPVSDQTAGRPDSVYGQLKLDAEAVVADAGSRLLAVSLRPPLVIGAGAGGNWRALQRLAATSIPLPLGGIRARRSYIGVDDLARAVGILLSGGWDRSLSGGYCVAPPDSLTIGQVVCELRAGTGQPARLFRVPARLLEAAGWLTGRSRQVASLTGPLVVDGQRFASTFGFSPAMSIREAIRSSAQTFALREGKGR